MVDTNWVDRPRTKHPTCSCGLVNALVNVVVVVGGPHEKMSFFQIASGPILSIPIPSKVCQYGPCKFSLKKKTPSLPTNPPKSAFFCH
jgi:hypothetical protein